MTQAEAETKHTPGPWEQRDTWGDLDANATMVFGGGYAIASLCHYHGREGTIANARLIAAAPDLLVALQTIALHAPSLDVIGIRELADAAIARATGAGQ